MYKIIALAGKAGSGKDTLMREVRKVLPDLHEIVSCTTRPKREGEVDGVNYHFLTHEEFAEKLGNGTMVEATIFNDWCYGTCLDNMSEDGINIGVYNPAGLAILQCIPDVSLYSIFIDADDKVRLLRQLNRETNPNVKEIIRRFGADEQDFSSDNLIDIHFQYTVDNSGEKSLDQLSHELANVIQEIDWRTHR